MMMPSSQSLPLARPLEKFEAIRSISLAKFVELLRLLLDPEPARWT